MRNQINNTNNSRPAIINIDPEFIDDVGPDLDLRLDTDSPCIDSGDTTMLPPDTPDLDGDEDLTEPIPLDLALESRVEDNTGEGVDMGAYERQ